ncbi:hypothetical protein ABZP36_011886 [Zizania latifolia]
MSEQSDRLKLTCFILSDWTAQAERWITSPARRRRPGLLRRRPVSSKSGQEAALGELAPAGWGGE